VDEEIKKGALQLVFFTLERICGRATSDAPERGYDQGAAPDVLKARKNLGEVNGFEFFFLPREQTL
jgi:hypothetical protein